MIEVEIGHRLGAFSLDARFAAAGGLTALFGRSGSGKTSVVNAIAGLLRPERGRITVDGEVLLDTARRVFVPAHRRRIGYVFQEGRLFPHLTVRQNLLFGRWFTPQAQRFGNLADVVELLDIAPLLDRRPGRLSGGEKQRVAIGRALLASPRLLLLDEPLAALDIQRKAEILPYVERLRDEAKVPMVYVSHAIEEVARLANTMVLMSAGRVEASGPVAEIMTRLDLTAGFEAGAVLEVRVAEHDAATGLTLLRLSEAAQLWVSHVDLAIGSAIRVRILARDVILAVGRPTGLSALNILPGRIAEVAPVGTTLVDVRLEVSGQGLLARVTRRSAETLRIAPGLEVYAVVKSVALDRNNLSGLQPQAADL